LRHDNSSSATRCHDMYMCMIEIPL